MRETFFVYGLSFFVLGLTSSLIAITNKTYYVFLDKLIFFGLFIFIKGIIEWQHVFLPLRFEDLYSNNFFVNLGHRLTVSLAMIFLCIYAVELLTVLNRKLHILRYVISLYFIAFYVFFFIFQGNLFITDMVKWSIDFEIACRRFLLIPGGLVAAVAILIRSARYQNKIALHISTSIFGILIAGYTLFVGIFVNDIDYTAVGEKPFTFVQFTGIRIEVAEIFFILSMLICIVIITYLLNIEYSSEKMHIRDVILLDSERERISRDMHDGSIQSLYGLSMRLGYMNIADAQHSIGNVISDIRNYIYDNLAKELHYDNLEEGINNLLNELRQATSLDIKFVYSNQMQTELQKKLIQNIFFIIREATLNIIKHASASQAEITVTIDVNSIHATVKDDGIGILKYNNHAGMGLITMRKRVEETLGGTFTIDFKKGTTLEIYIPMEEHYIDYKKSSLS